MSILIPFTAYKRLYSVAFLCLIFINTKAQIIKTDTTNNLFFYNIAHIENGIDSLRPADTLLYGFHLKHTFLDQYVAIQNQALIGTAMRPLELIYDNKGYFNEGLQSFDALRFSRNETMGISGKALSDLHYAQGYADLLYITAKHYQPLGKFASFNVNYRRIKQNDVYFNNLENLDKTRIPNLYNTALNFRLDPPSGKYLLFVQLTNNRINNTETGGLTEVPKFDSLPRRARLVNTSAPLPSAANVFRDFRVQINQLYKFNLTIDSTQNKNIRLFHEFEFARNRNRFSSNNADTGYFEHYFMQYNAADSQQFIYLNNRVGASFVLNKNLIKLGLKQQSIWYASLLDIKANYTTVFLQTEISRRNKNTLLKAKADYGVGGFNNTDLYLTGDYFYAINDNYRLHASIKSLRYQTSFNQQYLFSNHFIWDNNFKKQQDITGHVSITMGNRNKIKAEFTTALLNNFVYNNAMGLPTQMDKAFVWNKFKTSQHIKWGLLGNRNTLVLQQSGSENLPVPQMVLQSSLYADGWLFEKAMWMQFGVDFHYFSAYKATVYNPATRQFMVKDVGNFGNYPQIAVFLDAQVRTLSFMLTYQQINQLIINNRSDVLSPGYANLPNSFSLSIRWLLTN